ncbi:MAG: FHA domain-containing protein [Oscillospiraceae bacterium]|jgi:hypothetical protein|nr:FHA domain-containing protein [Oscillospiraceae bacterium]
MKRLGALFLALIAAFMLMGAAEPSAPLAVYYENHVGEPGVLSVYVNANYGGTPAEDDFSFSLSGQRLSPLALWTVASANEGVSWLFAVDMSGSVRSEKMELLRQTLTGLVEGLGENDNAAFLLIGDDAKATPFISDKTEMLELIAGLETRGEDTNLYKGIVTAAQILQTDGSVHAKRCVVVFSDGEDDIVEGFTREEAEQAVASAYIPFYTVALQDREPSGRAVEAAKVLAGFSRSSAGGTGHTLKPGGDDPGGIAASIADSVRGGYIVYLALADISLPQDQSLLEIRLTAAGQNAEDSLMVNAAELRACVTESPPETPAPGPEPSPAETDEPEQEQEPEPQSAGWLPFAAAGAAVLVAAVVLAVVLRARKKRAPSGRDMSAADIAPPENIPRTAAVTIPRPRWRFTFTKVGLAETDRYTLDVADELVIGRSAGQLTVPSDTRLSSRHCRIFTRDGAFYVEDLRSTNGTYLNGVPVAQPQRLEQDNILLLGSMELRVTWTGI